MPKIFSILFFISLTSLCFGMGQQGSPEAAATPASGPELAENFPEASPAAQKTTVTGTIRLVGNEPFTRLVLTSEDRTNYYLQTERLPFLMDLQGKQAEITGPLTSKPIYAANGKFITSEHSLIPETITYHDILRGTFKLTKTKEGTIGSLLVTTRNNSRKYTVQPGTRKSYEAYQDKQVEITGNVTIHLTFNAQGTYETSSFYLYPQSVRQAGQR